MPVKINLQDVSAVLQIAGGILGLLLFLAGGWQGYQRLRDGVELLRQMLAEMKTSVADLVEKGLKRDLDLAEIKGSVASIGGQLVAHEERFESEKRARHDLANQVQTVVGQMHADARRLEREQGRIVGMLEERRGRKFETQEHE